MFWKKKKTKDNDLTNIIGLLNTRDIEFSKSGDLLLTFSQAVICLLLCVGSICGYASCFGAEFNLTLILIVLSVASLVIAYARNLKTTFLKNIIYIGFLFLFAYFIMQYFRYVNSGYHALVNMTYASLENYLDIPALVHYEELIENSYSTITYFMIFLGIFELLLFHMWIGERIHLLSLFLVSFCMYLIPLFINLYPDDFYVVCLLTAYISLIMICLSFHINNHPTKQKDYRVFNKNNPWSISVKGLSYGASGKNYFATTIISLLMAMCIIAMVGVISPKSTYQNNLRTSKLKASVTDDVKYIVTFGLSGYFNRYDSAGGLSSGRLGGIYSVRPDYETDLTVTFAPITYEPLYLRGFVGIGYTDRHWYDLDMLCDSNYIDSNARAFLYNDITLENEFQYLKDINLSLSPYRITVKNVRADVAYNYTPYYCNPDNIPVPTGTAADAFMYGKTRDYPFYYYSPHATDNPNLTDDYYLSAYLQVPDFTRAEILEFLVDNDLCTEYIFETNHNYSAAETTLIINRLSECLTNDFIYSMNPGITPKTETYVGHFLDTRKGFCAHFATSATLILRTLGIPARYVEGYVVTTDDLIEGEILTDVNVNEYITPEFVETNPSVIRADIGDDKAHAWVEYYMPEFGWRVFEATTASMEMSTDTNFWRSLYGLLQESDTINSPAELNNINGISSGNVSRFMYLLLLIVISIIAGCFILYYSYKLIRQYRSYHRHRMNINVRNFYKIICATVNKKYPEFAFLLTYKEQFEFLNSHYKLPDTFNTKNTDKLCEILNQAAFSNVEISYLEFKFSMKLLKTLRFKVSIKL